MMLRVLHVASEAYPLIKTGGLGDVASALPVAQRALGVDARLLLPGYPQVLHALTEAAAIESRPIEIGAVFGAGRVRLWRASMPDNGLPLLVIDAPWLFARAGNPYIDTDGLPWSDNHLRFGLLGWMAAQIGAGALLDDWSPDVVHAHDWHGGLGLAWLAHHPGTRVRRIFTIHNLAFQGRFPLSTASSLSIPAQWLTSEELEFHGDLSFIKAGVVGAHCVTTVSPTYAREVLRPEAGEGLDGLLRRISPRFLGILNGIDEGLWNPREDPFIKTHYDGASLSGKAKNRTALQRECGLSPTSIPKKSSALAPRKTGRQVRRAPIASVRDGPLLGVVSRLTEQKGIDNILRAAPAMLAAGCQLVILGAGDRRLEEGLRALANANPQQVWLGHDFEEALAHRIVAGADAILVPSRFEPCGLTQMYGLRYGTLPLVRRVGGLADTIVDEGDGNSRRPANGFVFDEPGDFFAAIHRLVAAWHDQPRWRRLMRVGMTESLGWSKPARQYLDVYRD